MLIEDFILFFAHLSQDAWCPVRDVIYVLIVLGAVDIGNGVFWSGDFKQVKTLVNIGKISEDDIRLFIGYSGWSGGQLEGELKQNSWIVSDTDASLIFDTPSKSFWREVLKRMGGQYKVLSNYPTDPRLN